MLPTATAKATADLEAADGDGDDGAAPVCGDAAVARQRLANVLESLKSAGQEAHPSLETTDSWTAARAIVIVFALDMLSVAPTHWAHVMSDARFVTEAEEPRPHESRTLRVVRVLDVSVVVSWAALLLWLAHELGCRRRSPGNVRQVVLVSLGVVAVVYFVGALCDFGQCHLQAGGIGSQCNGMACLDVACLMLVCKIVGHWNPRFLAFAVLTAQGAHRLHWASRQPESTYRVLFGTIALCFVIFPLYMYAQELATAAQKLFVQRYQKKEKHDDENDKPAEKPEAGYPLVAALAVNSLPPRQRQDSSLLGAVGRISPRIRVLCEDAPERLKEDNSKVGTGPATKSDELMIKSEVRASAALDEFVFQSRKASHAESKRRRLAEQNQLLATLDRLLPDAARRGGFKGAGPRSAGVWGRSFFSILTDTANHLRARNQGNLDGGTTKNETLVSLGLSYRDVLLSSKTLVAMEVDLQGGELVVRTLGSGAQDWFAKAPWEVCKGVLLRELVHADSWPSLQKLEDALSAATATGSGLSRNNNMVLDIQLSHFQTSKYVSDHMDSTKPCAFRIMNTVEYVRAKVEVVISSTPEQESAQQLEMEENTNVEDVDTLQSATPEPAANHSVAILLFNMPESWQWLPLKHMAIHATEEPGSATPSEAANMGGHWVHVEDVNASSPPTLEQLIGSAHEFMGVFKLDRREVIGVQGGVEATSVKLAGLEWISSFLFDPTTFLDIRDREVMESVVTSFEQMSRSRSRSPGGEASSTPAAAARCRRDKIVTDCMELHSGMASTSLIDILTLSYRLKLPPALGGYESAWRPLYSHILNASVAGMEEGEPYRLTVIPSRRRSDVGKVELLLMVLHTDECGKVCVSQQLCLAKGTDSSSATLTGLISASQVPHPLRLHISGRKVGLGDKVLLDMDGPGPGDKEMMENAMVESLLDSTHGSDVCEWSNVKLTLDDVCLFFGEDHQSETDSCREGTMSPSPPCEA